MLVTARKQAAPATSPLGTALFGLSNESLAVELQDALRKGQDIIVVLSSRASRLVEMVKELTSSKEANARLELEVKRLKEAAAGDKKMLSVTRKKLEATEEKLKTMELESGSLSSTLMRRDRYFAGKAADVSSFLGSLLGEVGAHVLLFEVIEDVNPEASFFAWLETSSPSC